MDKSNNFRFDSYLVTANTKLLMPVFLQNANSFKLSF